MIYRYDVEHHVGPATYLFRLVRGWVNHQINRFVRPIASPVIQCCFVAGCGHSGTTLLTAKLGNHARVMAIGYETRIFRPTRLVFRAKRKIQAWMLEAVAKGKTHLIEKTPKHVHMLPEILRLIPGAKVVLTIRNPMDNCFSIYERFGDLEYAIQRWLMDNEAVLRMRENPRFKVIKYEYLASEPEQCLSDVCNFLSLECDSSLVTTTTTVYDREFGEDNMRLRREQVRQPIKLVSRKWAGKWSEAEITEVRTRTTALASKLGYLESELS